jgi:hypothetical protein
MFKVVVEAHNLKKIDSEPIPYQTFTGDDFWPTLARVIPEITTFVDHYGLNSFSLSIQISQVEK